MSPKVHADPSKFHQAADELHRMADELRQGGSRLLSATSDARSYDGQYAPWVRPIAQDGDHRIRGLSERIASLAHTLDLIAQGFEEADRLDRKGFSSLADQVRLIVESGFVVSTFPHWLTHGQCPPWINQDFWNRLLLDDRDAFLASLGGAWLDFVESGDYSHATEQDMLNAFLVYLFMEGVLSKPPELEVWKSAARAAGMSFEDYVMKMMDISEFDRDMVGGIGFVETPEVGPIPMAICSQAYLNRVLDVEEWGSYQAAWGGFASISGSDYYIELDGVPGNSKNYAQYLLDAIEGGTSRGNYPLFTATDYQHYLNNKELYSYAMAAEAAQDMSWRLIAGYKLADMAGDEYVTFFLNDEDSNWWNYHEDLMDAGLVQYETNAERLARYTEQVKNDVLREIPQLAGDNASIMAEVNLRMSSRSIELFPDPSTLDGAMEMIEISHQYGNQYESNPSYVDFVTLDRVNYKFNFESLPDGQEVVVPRYAGWVYKHADSLYNHPPFASAEAYQSHYRSLVFMYNEYNEQAFASYYFPTEDTVNLKNYGTIK